MSQPESPSPKTEVHLYADDTQLYLNAEPLAVDSKVGLQKLVTCVSDIGQWMTWMCANRLKLNQEKLFIWHGTPQQLSVQLQTITLGVSTS